MKAMKEYCILLLVIVVRDGQLAKTIIDITVKLHISNQ